MSRARQYQSEDKVGSSSFEKLTAKVERDLLNSITSCGSYDLFSRPWFEACPIYNRLAHVNEAEMKISDSKEGSTLWETEKGRLVFIPYTELLEAYTR